MSSHQDVRRKVRLSRPARQALLLLPLPAEAAREEGTLASLLIKEVRRRQQENPEFSPDHSRQPDENKEFDSEGEGEGVSTSLIPASLLEETDTQPKARSGNIASRCYSPACGGAVR